MSTEYHIQNPYPGPRPFGSDHEKLFFGRDRETDDLLSLLTIHPAVLLYAQSGAGKTSLLNAGLIPLMKQEGENFEVLPVARVRGFSQEGVATENIDNIYVFNALMSWAGEAANPDSLASMSIADFLEKRSKPKDEDGVELPRLVVFDQFEEIFTAHAGYWEERKHFFIQIDEALKQDPTLRVLFAIREDYLADLTPYAGYLPERLSARYRLERLRKAEASMAVKGPLQGTGRSFAEGVAESLVQKLLQISFVSATGAMEELTGEYVEPVQLQVVCRSLWANLPTDTKIITTDHLQEFGDVEKALHDFYETAITTAAEETSVSKDDLRRWFSKELITAAGTRGTVFQGAEQTGSIPNSAVSVLENQHIIRAEMRARARWYELTHDRLIEPIRKANEAWEQRQQQEEQHRQIEAERQRADEQQRRADEQTKTAKRFRRLTIALLISFFLALIAVGLAFRQTWVAEDRKNDALIASRSAEESAEEAKEALRKYEAEQERADEQTVIAKEKGKEAERARSGEKAARKSAEEKNRIALSQKLAGQAHNYIDSQIDLALILRSCD